MTQAKDTAESLWTHARASFHLGPIVYVGQLLGLDYLIFGKDLWLHGSAGLLLSVPLGLAGAIGQLLIFYRLPVKHAQ